MNKNRYGFVVGGLFVVWTAVILLLSLVPGDELPPAGWLARIPHFDKIVHCGFYQIGRASWRETVCIQGVAVASRTQTQ